LAKRGVCVDCEKLEAKSLMGSLEVDGIVNDIPILKLTVEGCATKAHYNAAPDVLPGR
jgi:hypothetical protein